MGSVTGDCMSISCVCVCVCVRVKAVLGPNVEGSMQAQCAGGSPGATQAACSRTGQRYGRSMLPLDL